MAAMESDRLDHVTVEDGGALTCLIGHNLAVRRVERSRLSGQTTIIWRNVPTPDDQLRANRLIGASLHSW